MRYLLLAALSGLMLGCSSAPPPATPMTFATWNTKENDQKQISLEGYVRLPAAALVSDTMLLELHEKPEGKSSSVDFSTRIGSGKNQVEKPPKDYSDKDLKLHANDGSLVGPQDKVRISGKVVYSPSTSILFEPIDVQKL